MKLGNSRSHNGFVTQGILDFLVPMCNIAQDAICLEVRSVLAQVTNKASIDTLICIMTCLTEVLIASGRERKTCR